MIRFYNGFLLTMESMEPIANGELWVDQGRIAYVGKQLQPKAGQVWEREINLQGNLLMPGFKNAHTHSPMTFLRSYADDLPLQEWLYQQVFPMEEKLTPDDIYWFTKLAVMEYLTSGITASFDMYVEPEANANANLECGFRTVLCGTVNDFKDSVAYLDQCYQKYNHYHPLIQYQLGFHAEYTTSLPLLMELAELSQRRKAPMYTHLAETQSEVEDCRKRYGRTPTQQLAELGMYDYGGGGFHCVHMTQEDLQIVQEKGLYVITNPASNMKLASGIAPITQMQEMGIPIAIGTDGPASNNCLDMFREMFLVTGLQKLRNQDAAACPAQTVLEMATVGGAHAMGLHDCDILAVGKQADLVVMDLCQPNMQPQNDMVKNLVYSGSKQNVILTMIAGKILYEKGTFSIGEDPARIYQKVNNIVKKMR